MSNKYLDHQREFIYTIPESILLDSSLVLTDIQIYMIVRSFMDSNKECWASNKWFGNKLLVNFRTIQTSLSRLEGKGYLIRTNINGVRTLSIKQTALIISGEDPNSRGGDPNATGGDPNATPPCVLDHRGGDPNATQTIGVKYSDQNTTTTTTIEAQILTKNHDSEPVVVVVTSKNDLNPKPIDPEPCSKPVISIKADKEVRDVYAKHPFTTEHIKNVDDVLSAMKYNIATRNDFLSVGEKPHSERGRFMQNIQFIKTGEFEEPHGWFKSMNPPVNTDAVEWLATNKEWKEKLANETPEQKEKRLTLAAQKKLEMFEKLGIEPKKQSTMQNIAPVVTTRNFKKIALPEQSFTLYEFDSDIIK